MNCELLFEKIDELYPDYIRVTEDVCNIESPTNFKKGVDAVGDYFIKMAEARGWKVEVCEQKVAGNAICITLNSDAKSSPVALSGHIDTVHPVGLFPTPAVRMDDKNMYGPGVMDCKGGVVASFLAMDALDKCGFRDRPVMLLIQSDEETGSSTSGKATINYICEKAKGAVAFLNTEGSVGNTLVLGRKGILRYEFTVNGIARHSAVCTEAANAITEAAYKIIELEKMKDKDGLTCNCGVISGGSTANTVAEKCVFTADIRFADDEQLEAVRAKVKELAENSVINGCTCEAREISFRPAMEKVERNYDLLHRINEINRTVGLPEKVARICASGSDAAYVTKAGIPCVDNIGVEGSFIHSIKEYIVTESISASAKQLAAVAAFI